ncbi:MAG: GSCFA domain-containing protein [Rhodospirillaceae bacterium]
MTSLAPPPDVDAAALAAAVEELGARTADPRVRDHIARAVAKSINAVVAPHLRPTGLLDVAARKLLTKGLMSLGALPSNQVAALANYLGDMRTRAHADASSAATVLAAPHVIEIAVHPRVLQTIREILGAPATLIAAAAPPVPKGPAANAFVRDGTGLKACRLRINLAEVPDTAPGEFVRYSADFDSVAGHLSRSGALTEIERAFAPTADEIFVQQAFKGEVIAFTGPAGSCFLYDPFALHRRPVGGEGMIVELTFALAAPADTAIACRDVAALKSRLAGDPLAHYAFRYVRNPEDSAGAVSAVAPPAIRLASQTNPSLARSNRGRTISVVRDPFIRRDHKVFAIGSCFALEIRKALAERGFDVYPKYAEIPFDPATQGLAKLPKRDNINHYNSFSIRQEFELAFGAAPYQPETFWTVPDGFTRVPARPLIQLQHRKQVYAADRAAAVDLNRKLDECIAAGIHQADVIIVTLGLIETWFSKSDGLAAATPPLDAPNSQYARFHLGTFAENYANIRRVTELVHEHYPEKELVFTVSPVALGSTFSGNDIVVANCESKSVLRAAVGQLVRDFPKVRYWPSYEIALAHDIFEDNGSHVTPEGVRMIMDAFLAAHLE